MITIKLIKHLKLRKLTIGDITMEQFDQLKQFKAVELKDNIADILLQAGYAAVVKDNPKPKIKNISFIEEGK